MPDETPVDAAPSPQRPLRAAPVSTEERSFKTAQAVVGIITASGLRPAFYPAVLRLAKQLLAIEKIQRARTKRLYPHDFYS